jgi:phosphoribosylaminoimidazolecarboxamide formyltransferase/IMP cyclohydrolase
MTRIPVRRALVSVYDKNGLAELARGLHEAGVEIVSTGSTAARIAELGVPVTPVDAVTGFPEILGGRVKTLHPHVHAGLLADQGNPEHLSTVRELGIETFQLVVVNLYPFRETVASGATPDEIVEQIDIGGPTLVRAAAKNFESVAVVVSPARYDDVVAELRRDGAVSRETRRVLAAEAFREIAAYDEAIAAWFAAGDPADLPELVYLALEKTDDLRYGENPHQRAALYRSPGSPGPLHGAEVLQGKAMSFNNWLDAEAALMVAAALPAPAVVIVKHNNPCGAAMGETLERAYRKAFASDTVSAFGGVVAVNTELDAETAAAIAEVFTEVVVAPSLSPEARTILGGKQNLRLLLATVGPNPTPDVRLLPGGALVQDHDAVTEGRSEMKVVSSREPTTEEWRDLVFAWTVAARVKSNAIVFAKDGATVGVGAGQMSRVDSVEIAAKKAGERSSGAVMASDAFFPFRDGIDAAAAAGVTAVIQPGGSVRDDEIQQAVEEHNMAMVLTGRRHFRH